MHWCWKTPVENAPRTSIEKHLSWSSDIPPAERFPLPTGEARRRGGRRRGRLRLCNYVQLIDTIFTDLEGENEITTFYRWFSINRFSVSVLPHICGLELFECSLFPKKMNIGLIFSEFDLYAHFSRTKWFLSSFYQGKIELFSGKKNFEWVLTRIVSIIWSLFAVRVIDHRFRFLLSLWST